MSAPTATAGGAALTRLPFQQSQLNRKRTTADHETQSENCESCTSVGRWRCDAFRAVNRHDHTNRQPEKYNRCSFRNAQRHHHRRQSYRFHLHSEHCRCSGPYDGDGAVLRRHYGIGHSPNHWVERGSQFAALLASQHGARMDYFRDRSDSSLSDRQWPGRQHQYSDRLDICECNLDGPLCGAGNNQLCQSASDLLDLGAVGNSDDTQSHRSGQPLCGCE